MNYGIAAKAVEGAMAAMGGQHTEVDRVTEWFGTTYPGKVLDGARKMLEFISHGNVNFVDRRGKNLAKIHADGCAHNNIKLDEGHYAYVMNLPGHLETRVGHVGSGMRLYLAERFFNPIKTDVDRAATVYHEIAHKVLATSDFVYKADPCRELASDHPEYALLNADTWSMYATSFIFRWPTLVAA